MGKATKMLRDRARVWCEKTGDDSLVAGVTAAIAEARAEERESYTRAIVHRYELATETDDGPLEVARMVRNKGAASGARAAVLACKRHCDEARSDENEACAKANPERPPREEAAPEGASDREWGAYSAGFRDGVEEMRKAIRVRRAAGGGMS